MYIHVILSELLLNPTNLVPPRVHVSTARVSSDETGGGAQVGEPIDRRVRRVGGGQDGNLQDYSAVRVVPCIAGGDLMAPR